MNVENETTMNTEDRPYPTDEELEDLYKVNENACLDDEQFENFVARETGPQPMSVGQVYLINGTRFRLKKITKKDIVLRQLPRQ